MKKTSKKSSRMQTRIEEQPTLPLLEKIVAITGLVIVLGLLGMIAWEASDNKPKNPEIKLIAVETVAQSQGFLVRFEAENIGNTAARELLIEGKVGEEKSHMTMDYLPAQATRAGGLFFTTRPQGLELRALGYQQP